MKTKKKGKEKSHQSKTRVTFEKNFNFAKKTRVTFE